MFLQNQQHHTDKLNFKLACRPLLFVLLWIKPSPYVPFTPPPTMVFNSTHLKDLINQLPPPFGTAGDFNSHNILGGVPFREPSDLKQAHWITLEVCKNHQEISITNWFSRGSALGPIGGLSARQFDGCLPRREEKRYPLGLQQIGPSWKVGGTYPYKT